MSARVLWTTRVSYVTLTHCLVCGYSLQGLGTTGRCPECGHRFERQCIVVRPRRFAWRGGELLVEACYAMISLLGCCGLIGSTVVGPLTTAWTPLLCAALLGFGVIALYRCGYLMPRTAQFLLVDSYGVCWRYASLATIEIAWRDIRDIKFEVSCKTIVLFLLDGTRQTLPAAFIPLPKAARGFAEQLMEFCSPSEKALERPSDCR